MLFTKEELNETILNVLAENIKKLETENSIKDYQIESLKKENESLRTQLKEAKANE